MNKSANVGNVEINAENFPDDVFREYVATKFDKDSDGILSQDEINVVTEINVSLSDSITDLTGIKFFTRLKYLECRNTKIKELDVSQNTSLEWLHCDYTGIKELDVSQNTSLIKLHCDYTGIKELDISQNASLIELQCDYTGIKELDISQNTSLIHLSCGNTEIKELNISQNTFLIHLRCDYTGIKELNITQNTSLKWLHCDYTGIKELDVSQNASLIELHCDYTGIKELDVSQNTSLIYLSCGNTEIKELDINQNTSLIYLICNNTKINELDITKNTSLELLSCGNTEIKELDVNNNSKTSKKSLLKKDKIITKRQIQYYSQETSSNTITGIPTGFTELDCMLSGLQPGHLILIGAFSGMGKSALALSIAQHVACHANITTVIVSEEAPKEQIANRLCLMESGIKEQLFYTPTLSEVGWRELTNEVLFNKKLHLIIDDLAGMNVQELRHRCEKYKSEHNMGLVIIDYLQLLSGYDEHRTFHSRIEEATDITRSLKQLAENLNIPIIVLSALSRQCIYRGLPTLSDICVNAKYIDDIIFIHNNYYKRPGIMENAELIIARQKNGSTGRIKLKWLPEYIKFANIKG